MSTNLDPEFFKVIEDHERKLRLIIPNHSAACANTIWTNQNKWYRSRVETLSGDTVSQGFSKFLNLGQDNPDIGIHTQDILSAIHNNERVVATLKYDGSCLIRSVYKGEVFFRTRGSLAYQYHDMAEEEMTLFKQRYPKLTDPTWEPNRSLLFEWVTPAFQIVVPYKEPDLYLLAGVDHGHRHFSHLKYLTVEQLEPISQESGIKLIEYHTIDSVKDWHHFYRDVLDHKEIEGYVLRLNGEQDLVKIKSQPYLTKHGIKSNLSFKSMVEFWLQHGQETVYHSILGQLEKLYDEEVVMWALPFVDNLFVAVEKWTEIEEKVRELVAEHQHWPRKDFAIKMQKEHKDIFGLLMQVWQGKEIEDKQIRNFMMQFDQGVKGQFDS